MDVKKEIHEIVVVLNWLRKTPRKSVRMPHVKKLQNLCVAGGWKLADESENIQIWIHRGNELVIDKINYNCSLGNYLPYGTMNEEDRVRYFNETYMKERGKRGVITSLDQVEWGCLKALKYSEEFEYVFADYLLR